MNNMFSVKNIKMSLSFFLFLLVSPTLSVSSPISGDMSTKYTDETRENAGMRQQKTLVDDSGRRDTFGDIDDTLLDVVIYNDSFSKINMGAGSAEWQGMSRGNIKGIALASPETDLLEASVEAELKWKEEKKKRDAIIKEEAKRKPSYFVGGYCTIPELVKIVRNSEFTNLDCLLDFGNGEFRDATVFAGVYPNYKKETLTVLPIFVTFKNKSKANFNGIVMTGERSSLNIADHIERFKIRELVAEYGLAINDVAYRYATLYMSNLISSRVRTQVDYVSVPNNNGVGGSTVQPIVTNKVAPPNAYDFFAVAGIELVSKLFSIGAKNALEDTSPLFTIYRGKRVHIDGVVSFDTEGLGRKYGKIQGELKDNSIRDNSTYTEEKSRIINSYKNNTSEGATNILNFTQQQTPYSTQGQTIPTNQTK